MFDCRLAKLSDLCKSRPNRLVAVMQVLETLFRYPVGISERVFRISGGMKLHFLLLPCAPCCDFS